MVLDGGLEQYCCSVNRKIEPNGILPSGIPSYRFHVRIIMPAMFHPGYEGLGYMMLCFDSCMDS